jgi:short-subunit dehydrogenase
MVSLNTIYACNTLISSTLPSRLVAIFVGATSGIGEITLKKFARYIAQPRIYFIGRSQEAADRIISECKILNADGEYNFIKADISLIRNVDSVCAQIKRKEKVINLLFLSCGQASFDRSGTSSLLTRD